MNKQAAHDAQHRNFRRTLSSAAEHCKWFAKSLGGDVRLEEAMEMWYARNPDKDIRSVLELEPDECTDPTCIPCTDPVDW